MIEKLAFWTSRSVLDGVSIVSVVVASFIGGSIVIALTINVQV